MFRLFVLTAILAVTTPARAEAPSAADAQAQAGALLERLSHVTDSGTYDHAAAELQSAELTKRLGLFTAPLTYRDLTFKAPPPLAAPAKSCRTGVKATGTVKDAAKLPEFGQCFAVSVIALAGSDKPESWITVDPNKPTNVLGKANQKAVKAMFGKLASDHLVIAAMYHQDNDKTAYIVFAVVKQGSELKVDAVLFTPWG